MDASTSSEVLPRLLTADQVAEQTGLSRWRVYELARDGELPCVRFGRAIRFDPGQVRERLRGDHGVDTEGAGAGR